MIRVMEVKSCKDFTYCKKNFKKDIIYKAYIKDRGIIVMYESEGILFDNRIMGHFIGDKQEFKENFEIIKEDIVKNKAELKEFLIKNKFI
ncbi:hypothetical protein [Metabacillus fastidiosus]|uniref:hypothetical protein n=1 Tax=Metabacillus fastidiosus TaxID=1458 RepID=UPI003D28B214